MSQRRWDNFNNSVTKCLKEYQYSFSLEFTSFKILKNKNKIGEAIA